MTDVPSLKALVANSCSLLTLSILPANTERTDAARAPSNFISSKIGASLFMPPTFPNVSNNWSKASFASFSTNSVKDFTSRPAIEANLAGSLNIFIMTPCKAVEDISTCCIFWSNTEAKPIICETDMLAWFPTPAKRAVKSTKYGSAALEFWATSLTALPTDNMAFFSPIWSASPNIWLPNEIRMISPASANSNRSFFEVIPKRPASAARLFNSVLAVRVSIFWNSSFSSFTCSLVIPVYLRTSASASSNLA